jgi:integrase
VKGVLRLGVRLGNWLTPEQGRRLLTHSEPATPRQLRDYAMLAMLIGCGLRRGELLALTLESIQQREEHLGHRGSSSARVVRSPTVDLTHCGIGRHPRAPSATSRGPRSARAC